MLWIYITYCMCIYSLSMYCIYICYVDVHIIDQSCAGIHWIIYTFYLPYSHNHHHKQPVGATRTVSILVSNEFPPAISTFGLLLPGTLVNIHPLPGFFFTVSLNSSLDLPWFRITSWNWEYRICRGTRS